MKKTWIALAVFAVCQLGLMWLLLHMHERKDVYADTIRLFNEYRFKVDLEKASQATLLGLKARLDSAEVMYKLHPADLSAQQQVLQQQQILEQGYNTINKEINQKVWERLNPLIHRFGKEHNLDLIIGANGMGTVLYGTDKKDITEELIHYINERYEKGN